MKAIAIVVVAAAALALSPGAAAGGFATVGVEPLPQDGIEAGATWRPTLTVLQHGRTPLDGVKPTLTIRNLETGERRTFDASPIGEPGRYAVEVVFPTTGRWAFAVDDGFSQTHTFAPVTVGGTAAAASAPRSVPWTALAAGGALAVALAAAVLVALRRRPPRAAPAA